MIKIQETTVAINAPVGGYSFSVYARSTISTLDSVAPGYGIWGQLYVTLRNPPAHVYAATGNYDISPITTTSGCQDPNGAGGIDRNASYG